MRNELEQQNKPTSKSDEIDISILFDKIGLFFTRISTAINSFILFVKRNLIFIALITALGIVLSFLAYRYTRPFYTSSITLIIPDIRNEFIEDQLIKVADMVRDENYEALSNRLDISVDYAQQMKKMEFSNLDSDRIESDSILTGSPFRVHLSLYDRSLFDSMEVALIGYLERNRYISKHRNIKRRQISNLVAKLKSDIASIDSMRTNVSTPTGPVNGFIYGQPIDPTNLYKEGNVMYKQQVEMEAELQQLESVEIVTSFVPRLKPTGPNLFLYLAIGALISFVMGSILANSREGKKTANK